LAFASLIAIDGMAVRTNRVVVQRFKVLKGRVRAEISDD